jgi:hypothetical protein
MRKIIIIIFVLLSCSCTQQENRRFEVIHNEAHSMGNSYTILLDKETGTKYLKADAGFGGGIVVLQENPNN